MEANRSINRALSGEEPRSQGSTYILAIGFGTAVVMWAIGYICRIPPALTPSWLLLLLLLAAQFLGGFVAGRTTSAGWRGGLLCGGLTALINLLVLGSLLGGRGSRPAVPDAILWIPGSIIAGMVLGAAGAALSGRTGREPSPIRWTPQLARVGVGATLLLLVAGGVVTSEGAGLAVTDWPNSFGYNMFLFPLSRMTGPIYYEHAHRLIGALVGLTTLVLAIHLQVVERRRWLRGVALLALLLVIVQGILGGLRVTGTFTTAMSPAATAPNLKLAVVHGVVAQIFFSLMVCLAVFTSDLWRRGPERLRKRTAGTDRRLTAIFVGLVVVQLVLGAIYRHFSHGLHLHLTLAAVVIVVGLITGTRAMGLYGELPLFRKLGMSLIHLLGLQLLLGIGSLIAMAIAAGASPPPLYEVIVTTAHQGTGALILGCGVLLLVWERRFIVAPAPA
jgi:cytochrome c oxidase assembly protein subunit 15